MHGELALVEASPQQCHPAKQTPQRFDPVVAIGIETKTPYVRCRAAGRTLL